MLPAEMAWVAVLIAIYFVVYATLAILRHTTYHSFGYDLGLYDQVFWNTIHGRWWESTMSLGQPTPHSYFGDHFSPIYVALLPAYLLVPRPETLVVIQAGAIALGAIPIALLARHRFPDSPQPVVWTAAYFLFLPVAHITLYDFHETALAILPLGFALYFLERGRTAWFLFALAIAVLVKEEIALVGIGIGVYAIARRKLVLGSGVAVGSLAAFLAILYAIIPRFSGGHGFAYFGIRYGQLGDNPLAILRTFVTRPGVVVQTLAQAKKGAFLLGLFGPVLALPVLSGWGLILLVPTLGYLLLSSYEPQFSFTKQYVAPLIPLILGTAIYGLTRVPARARALVSGGVLLSSLAFAYLYGNLPFSRRFDVHDFLTEARYSAFAPLLRTIPADASVAAENNLTPHLDQRQRIYGIEYEGIAGADYVALDMAATNRDPTAFQAQLDGVERQGYELVASGPGLALLKRR